MKVTLKAVLTGTVVIVALQLLLGVLIKAYVASAAAASGGSLAGGINFNILYLGISLGTFFVGGLIVGFMGERLNLGEPVVAGGLGLLLSALVLSGVNLPDNTFLMMNAQKGIWGAFIVIVAVAVLATLGGGLIGERIRMPSADDALARRVMVAALALVLVGPVYLLVPYGLPWYIAVMATLVLLILVGVGFYMFTQGTTFEQSIEEISISPDRHRES